MRTNGHPKRTWSSCPLSQPCISIVVLAICVIVMSSSIMSQVSLQWPGPQSKSDQTVSNFNAPNSGSFTNNLDFALAFEILSAGGESPAAMIDSLFSHGLDRSWFFMQCIKYHNAAGSLDEYFQNTDMSPEAVAFMIEEIQGYAADGTWGEYLEKLKLIDKFFNTEPLSPDILEDFIKTFGFYEYLDESANKITNYRIEIGELGSHAEYELDVILLMIILDQAQLAIWNSLISTKSLIHGIIESDPREQEISCEGLMYNKVALSRVLHVFGTATSLLEEQSIVTVCSNVRKDIIAVIDSMGNSISLCCPNGSPAIPHDRQ